MCGVVTARERSCPAARSCRTRASTHDSSCYLVDRSTAATGKCDAPVTPCAIDASAASRLRNTKMGRRLNSRTCIVRQIKLWLKLAELTDLEEKFTGDSPDGSSQSPSAGGSESLIAYGSTYDSGICEKISYVFHIPHRLNSETKNISHRRFAQNHKISFDIFARAPALSFLENYLNSIRIH